jgi:hypothetical protein
MSSVERTHVLGKVVFDEDPTATRLGSGDRAAFRPASNFFRMHVEHGGSLGKRKRTHWGRESAIRGYGPGHAGFGFSAPEIHRGNLLATVPHLVADYLPRLAIDGLLLRRELL